MLVLQQTAGPLHLEQNCCSSLSGSRDCGYKTNDSLRATTATRLYQSGVDEQLVMERTGHRSLEGVHNYKRTADMQREALSDILNSKKPRMDGTTSNAVTVYPSTSHNPEQKPPMFPVMNAANVQTTTKNCIPGASCSSVTINMHCNGSN